MHAMGNTPAVQVELAARRQLLVTDGPVPQPPSLTAARHHGTVHSGPTGSLRVQAMGDFGATAILAELAARGRAGGGRVRALTHCNTGSLATAAYGTALGVVRALAQRGALERAFCTETRPYNQGAAGRCRGRTREMHASVFSGQSCATNLS